jgi:hypothetical protein
MEFGGRVLNKYIYTFSFTKNVATLAIIHSRNYPNLAKQQREKLLKKI